MSLDEFLPPRAERRGECVFDFKMCLSVCGVMNWQNWPLMVVVLFMKNMAKLSSVKADRGGGGQRREEKNLERV